MAKVDLKDLDLEETRTWVEKIGLETYRAEQIRRWIFGHQAGSFEEMTNLSKEMRHYLNSISYVSQLKIAKTEISLDGTKKFSFELEDGKGIESVLIPERAHYTACISSQVGCAMGCKFCLTGRRGLNRNLKASEIINQILQIRQSMDQPDRLTNIVFMGMGEPLANFWAVKSAVKNIICADALNFSRRRVTLSTCGLVPEIERLGKELPINLAVSLNAADDKTRNLLMPINRRYPLNTLIDTLMRFPLTKRGRITFEYILIRDINDRLTDATKLARLLKDIRAKINLIPFNVYNGTPFQAPDEGRILAFQDELIRKNYTVIIRKSKGTDISAACGQLTTGP
ncbi:MAG: 23S rRNA (adenine(2503)-C(2))-methyltransferase RlmN [Deltaproteobacteria bacterium]|nr:MAG: 23S rRNA (adenine(2503)-C(2))-methyltransferase RlmN [Deltaproteobacteria bacterium]